jgi:lysozyme
MSTPIATAETNQIPNSDVAVSSERLWKPWHISNDGLSFIAVWESGKLNGINFQGHSVTEGFILKAYYDNVGIPTVGCGHRIVSNDNISVGQTISLERARAFKKQDIANAEHRLNSDVSVPLFQYEYDALVSIVYNCGAGNGADSLIRNVNSGSYSSLRSFISSYRVGSNHGVHLRRESEARLFATGSYDASH